MKPAAEQEARPTGVKRKAAKRSSRSGENASSMHFGPVACTSSAAALLQAYLAVDADAAAAAAAAAANTTPHPGNSGTNGFGGMSGSTSNVKRTGERLFLHMSESKFDPIKRRFGGKSRLVSMTTLADGGSGSTTTGKGARLSFGPSTKVVATREVMYTALHCRCVFVLLCEMLSETSAEDPSLGDGQQPDTAHLVALSPNDLFVALSVASFPIVASEKGAGNNGSSGSDRDGGGSRSGSKKSRSNSHPRARMSVAFNTLPRSFEIADGPMVLHRPTALVGQSWQGLEIFRPGVAARRGEPKRPWIGQMVLMPPAVGEELGGMEVGGVRLHDGGEAGKDEAGSFNLNSFRLDLSGESASGENTTSRRSGNISPSKHRRAGRGTDSPLVVCPFGVRSTAEPNFSPSPGYGNDASQDDVGASAAVVALPLAGENVTGLSEVSAADATKPKWAFLSFDSEGQASLSPWLGPPSSCRTFPTCLCRAPDIDSGMVRFAGVSSGRGAGGLLEVKPLPPTTYVGMVNDRGGNGGGSLLELQGARTLSCSRSLPGPPRAIMTAAVDDARGVLAVLLADPAETALLLARDGANFPVVERYRGVSAAFTGDFLGNGREQVALLPSGSSASMGAANGAGVRLAAALAAKAGVGGWEQLPLKALVKRALVTDCSCIWGNGQRDDLAALPGAGPIQVVRVKPNASSGRVGSGGSGAALDYPAGGGALSGAESSKGRKRQRSEGREGDSGKSKKTEVSVAGGAGVGSSIKKRNGSDFDHRLGRLSTVVGILRRRVNAEEKRLFQLRQARRGKASALEAAKVALAMRVGNGIRPGGTGDLDTSGTVRSISQSFYAGQVIPGDMASSSPQWKDATEAVAVPQHYLQCALEHVRFHTPTRALCLDVRVSNLPCRVMGALEEGAAISKTALKVCLSVSCAPVQLTTRSAVCSRLDVHESATIRACVQVPLLAVEAASLCVSCTWTVPDAGRTSECSVIFARVLVSPQDMLGVGALSSKAGKLLSFDANPHARTKGLASRTSVGGGDGIKGSSWTVNGRSHDGASKETDKDLGLFDVGRRLDLLVHSDTSSLAVLPQAVRSLSMVASMPEPWAGGASAAVGGCSERAAECALRAGDSPGSMAVLLRVAAGALPDGTQASANHASDQGRALILAAALALRDEIVALDHVARERRGISANGTSGREGSGTVRNAKLVAALERYTAAQRRSDLLAAQLAGRVAPFRARGVPRERGGRPTHL